MQGVVQVTYDPHALVILTGVAIKIAQRIGLHRDGTLLDLPPFQTEIRRRLWWHLYLIDGQVNRVIGTIGTAGCVERLSWDTKIPLNINDEDLRPDMKEFPPSRHGVTEMIICLIKCEMSEFMVTQKSIMERDGGFKNSANRYTIEDRQRAAEEFERMMQRKYTDACDPLIPLHFLAIIALRTFLCKVQIVIRHPRLRPSMPVGERDILLNAAVKMIEYTNLIHSTKSLRKFFWPVKANFQLESLVFMLGELRSRTTGDLADKAWLGIEEVFEYHADMVQMMKNPLHIAMGNLLLQAWEARKFAHGPDLQVPGFVKTLYKCRNRNEHGERLDAELAHRPETIYPAQRLSSRNGMLKPIGESGLSFISEPIQPDLSSLDWPYWDDLFHGYSFASNPHDGIS
jgi:Fungal specific transcription factor domain